MNAYKIKIKDGEVGALYFVPEGEIARKNIPLVYLNGGPGGTYLGAEKILAPAITDRPVVLYDQLGSYHSPAPFGEYLMSMERYVAELKSVLDYFDMSRAIILGHSFGGSIAVDFALAHPDRVAGAIFSSPLLSTPRWIADANLLLEQLPEAGRSIIQRQLAGEAVDQETYEMAERVFYARHVCRLDPWPDILLESFSKGNKALYESMWGRSEFVCTGTLKDYERFPDLHKLSMPVLLSCGRHDEARPETIQAAAGLIPDSSLHIFEGCSHTPMMERTEEYLSLVRDFCAGM